MAARCLETLSRCAEEENHIFTVIDMVDPVELRSLGEEHRQRHAVTVWLLALLDALAEHSLGDCDDLVDAGCLAVPFFALEATPSVRAVVLAGSRCAKVMLTESSKAGRQKLPSSAAKQRGQLDCSARRICRKA